MILSDKKIRKIIREEILKKKKINEALDSDQRWKKMTQILGISDKPTKVEFNSAWNKFVKSKYKEFEGGPSINELLAQSDVDSALANIPDIESGMEGEEKMFIFLKKYKDREGSESLIKLGQKANWDYDVTLKLDKKGRIITDDGQFDRMVGGVVDSLDGRVSKENIKDVYDTYKALKGKKVKHPATGADVDAVKWLHRKYKAEEDGDTISGDVKGYRDDEDLQDYADPLYDIFSRFVEKEKVDESISSRIDLKSKMVLREMIRRQIRQLNEALPVGEDRLAEPASGATVQTQTLGQLAADKPERVAGVADKWKKGAKIRAVWMKEHPDESMSGGDGKKHNAMVIGVEGGGKYTIKWEKGGAEQTGTPEALISRRSSGSGRGSKYSTFKTEMWEKGPMKRNHKGDIVQKLQQALQKKTEGLKDDKYFGPNTEKALVAHPANEAKSKTVTKELFDKIVAYTDSEEGAIQTQAGTTGQTNIDDPDRTVEKRNDQLTRVKLKGGGQFDIVQKAGIKNTGQGEIVIDGNPKVEKPLRAGMVAALVAQAKTHNDKLKKGNGKYTDSEGKVHTKKAETLPDKYRTGVITITLPGITAKPGEKVTLTKAIWDKASVHTKGDWGPLSWPGKGKLMTNPKYKAALWKSMWDNKVIVPVVEAEPKKEKTK